jgi:hypothetical protein
MLRLKFGDLPYSFAVLLRKYQRDFGGKFRVTWPKFAMMWAPHYQTIANLTQIIANFTAT